MKLASASHSGWLAGATKCNYMRLHLGGEKTDIGAAFARGLNSGNTFISHGKGSGHTTGVHPLDVLSEPRAPSPGRALLCSMYTALGELQKAVGVCECE